MQIADAKSREDNLRRMHETFMDALQGLSADSNKGQVHKERIFVWGIVGDLIKKLHIERFLFCCYSAITKQSYERPQANA